MQLAIWLHFTNYSVVITGHFTVFPSVYVSVVRKHGHMLHTVRNEPTAHEFVEDDNSI